jgi:dipeptidyl aminopeptidase/acylaminoacyl peptidase
MLPRLALFAGLTLGSLLTSHAPAQGTKAEYENAAKFDERFNGRIFRQSVDPQWVNNGTAFSYRVSTAPGQHEFFWVDAVSGKREPLCDLAALATAFRSAGVTDANPNQLPLAAIERDGSGIIRTSAFGRRWQFNPANGTLEALAKDDTKTSARRLPLGRRLRSGPNGPESAIIFKNDTTETLKIAWIDSRGSRTEYGELKPGESREQHTFAGHVWGFIRPDGVLFAAAAAEPQPVLFAVNDLQPGPLQGRRPESPRPPEGKPLTEVFLRDGDLFAKSPDGTEKALSSGATKDFHFTDARFVSPDGRWLIALKKREGQHRIVTIVESTPKDQKQPKLIQIPYDKPGDAIDQHWPHLFDLKELREVPLDESLFPNPWEVSDFLWLPDSSAFLFRYNQRGHQILRVLKVEPAAAKVSAIVSEESKTFIDYNARAWLRYLSGGREFLWSSERSGWHHLYLVDSITGTMSPVTSGDWVLRNIADIDEANRSLLISLCGYHKDQNPYHIHWARVRLDGSGFTMLTEGDGTHSLSWAPDRNSFIDSFSRVDLPPVHELRRASDGSRLAELEKADISALTAAGWPAPERFTAKGRDGKTDIHGVIIRPSTFDPAKRYPIVEDVYAGPQDNFVPLEWRTSFGNMTRIAELGFIVVQADGMGTANRSKAFHDVCFKNLGDAGFLDRIAWIKAAASSRPFMDLDHVGIFGGSAGGQNAMRALIAHHDFYKAAVADCGCHDNRMDKIWWNEQWMSWPLDASYDEASNSVQAHRIEGKLMLVVGEIDQNVDPASTMQVVDALVKANKDFDLLVMPGTNHGAAETPYSSRRRADFLVRNLMGTEPRSR